MVCYYMTGLRKEFTYGVHRLVLKSLLEARLVHLSVRLLGRRLREDEVCLKDASLCLSPFLLFLALFLPFFLFSSFGS